MDISRGQGFAGFGFLGGVLGIFDDVLVDPNLQEL
jgi:hypothetical protein